MKVNKLVIDINQTKSNYDYRPRTISITTFKILFYFTRREDSAYFSEIKEYLNRSSSQVSQTMKRLRLKNYVKTINSRPLKYTITVLGRKVIRKTIQEFLKYRDKDYDERKENNIKKTLRSHKKNDNEVDLLNYTELEEYYKDLLISFFIELPEILLDLNINFTPEKYHRFV